MRFDRPILSASSFSSVVKSGMVSPYLRVGVSVLRPFHVSTKYRTSATGAKMKATTNLCLNFTGFPL